MNGAILLITKQMSLLN